MNIIKKAFFVYKQKGIKVFIYRIFNYLGCNKVFSYLAFKKKPAITTHPNKFEFENHDAALKKRYELPEPLAVAKISNLLLSDLRKLIEDAGDESIIATVRNDKIDNHLLIDNYEDSIIQELENILIAHPIHAINPMEGPISRLHKELRDIFKVHIKSPFVFVNTRAWSTKANSLEFGPNTLHTDGFEPGHMKIMVYITPLNDECGYLKVEGGSIKNRPAGTSVCFSNSDFLHCGVPGNKYERTCIEVTLMRAFIDAPQFDMGSFFGRHFTSPEVAYNVATKMINECTRGNLNSDRRQVDISGKKINIGSGIRDWPDWICFDELDNNNVTKLRLDENVILPLEDKSVSLAYSSHNFEHLPDATIFKVLSELRRALKDKGLFLLKIPDYDWFLAQYRSGVEQSMLEKGVEKYISDLWSAAQRENIYENSLSMMFCGYWTKEYGDHFSGNYSLKNKNSYHGPAKVSIEDLHNIFLSSSPKEIVTKLKDIALLDPSFQTFNHQNAWSRDELEKILQTYGFRVVSMDTDKICMQFYKDIPDLLDMGTWSSYYLCEQVS